MVPRGGRFAGRLAPAEARRILARVLSGEDWEKAVELAVKLEPAAAASIVKAVIATTADQV